MRFLHLADLHLGKQMNDISLLEDQKAMLCRILALADAEEADAVLIAGDVYQRSMPQAEAVALFDFFLTELSKRGLPVLVISGNHDCAERVSYGATLLKNSGVYLSERFDGKLQRVVLQDAYGEISVWLLPFLRPGQVRLLFPEENITNSREAMAAILRAAPVDPEQRNVLVCHALLGGSEPSGSEEISVGTLDAVPVSTFDAFDYVALGHIHRPQSFQGGRLRYAGSPLKYSFSEAAHQKSVTIAEIGAKGDLSVRAIPLAPLHDVRLLSGSMAQLLALPRSEDYLWITLTDELVAPDARQTLAEHFPNLMKFSVANSKTSLQQDFAETDSVALLESKSVTELFCDFYRLQNNGESPTEKHLQVLAGILRQMDETGGTDV